MKQDYFKAWPFVNDDDAENPVWSWDNYGGIYYDDGTDHGWIEDSHGLTKLEAESLAKILNESIDETLYVTGVLDKINNIIKTFINTQKKHTKGNTMKTIRSEIEELLLLLVDYGLLDIVNAIEEGETSSGSFEKYDQMIQVSSLTQVKKDQINKILQDLLWLITIE
jgi:hypothetical protein